MLSFSLGTSLKFLNKYLVEGAVSSFMCSICSVSHRERERERERERLFSIACLGAKKQKKVKVVTCILKSNHKHNTESFYIFPLIFISQNLQCSHIHIISLPLSLSLSLSYSSVTRFKW